MAIINASQLLDNAEAARLEGERLSVSKLGIEPDDFRNFCEMFVDGEVRRMGTLDPTKTRQIVEIDLHGRKYTLTKTSFAKEFRSSVAIHRRCIFDLRSADWRFLFYGMSTNKKDADVFEKIRVNLPMGGRQFVCGVTCVGDREAMQKEAVLLRLFKEHP